MSPLRVRLFGGFSLQRGDCDCESLQSGRARELLCYLLLHRSRPHSREVLASLLWGDRTTAQSKKYFRQTLWQLQQVLHAGSPSECGLVLRTDGESVRLECGSHLWLDTALFETALAPVRGTPGANLDEQKACSLRRAVELYRGELLEGWYQDWCLFHRERLRNSYELMLEKLMGYCETCGDFEAGQGYGELLLRQDQARERTYYRLMRLNYLAGDRARAFRLFHRCEEVLKKELGVQPGKRIVELYDKLRTSQVGVVVTEGEDGAKARVFASEVLGHRLRRIRSLLLKVRRQLERDIREVDKVLETRRHGSEGSAVDAGSVLITQPADRPAKPSTTVTSQDKNKLLQL